MNGAEEAINIVKVAADASTAMPAAHGDLSMFALFAQASFLVKLVILLLIACSFWSWTIIFAKASYLRKLKEKADRFEEAFWNCSSLESFYDDISDRGDNPFIAVFIAGMKEWRRSRTKIRSTISAQALIERMESVMRVTIGREIDYLEQHIGFLATVGSTAPFVGLFGTVWGIMNSFEAIGLDQNTSLTSVAPGIAEALFATALGLIVTIPAVVAYNKISGDINRLQSRMEAFIDEFSAIVSRQLEDSDQQQQQQGAA
ncbi:MAG: protein TolQ [Alphaproteobacteria bacterium]|nr:protein TolQ [Alphaproteobacteria bacterium]